MRSAIVRSAGAMWPSSGWYSAPTIFGVSAAIAELDQRPELLDLRGRDDLERYADGIGSPAILLILIHALATGSESQIAGHMKAHILAGLRRQPLVQIDRIFVQLADRIAHVEKWQQTGGVPGRTRSQLGALDEDDVRPAFLRQMIEGAHSNHAAADHHDPRMTFHFEPAPLIRCGQCSRRCATGSSKSDRLMSELDMCAVANGYSGL